MANNPIQAAITVNRMIADAIEKALNDARVVGFGKATSKVALDLTLPFKGKLAIEVRVAAHKDKEPVHGA